MFLREAPTSGYELVLLEEDSQEREPAALGGFRVLPTSRGRILLLEDLVVAEEWRGFGAGAALMTWLEAEAADAHCARIELDTGRTNTAAQGFYSGLGMSAVAVHFSIDVDKALSNSDTHPRVQ
jgi:GNAT superfamily N-acetyltransferase